MRTLCSQFLLLAHFGSATCGVAWRSCAEATTDGGTMDEGIDSIHIDPRAAMRRHSTRSYRHGQRVGLLAAAFGDWLGLEASHVGRLRYAAELHDIGKLALSAELLEKPGALDAQEWQSMRLHPAVGHRLLRQTIQNRRLMHRGKAA